MTPATNIISMGEVSNTDAHPSLSEGAIRTNQVRVVATEEGISFHRVYRHADGTERMPALEGEELKGVVTQFIRSRIEAALDPRLFAVIEQCGGQIGFGGESGDVAFAFAIGTEGIKPAQPEPDILTATVGDALAMGIDIRGAQ